MKGISINNLHISLNEATNASRILKETNSILDFKIAQNVFISALYKEGLEKEHFYRDNLTLNRFELKSRKFSRNFFIQIIKYFEYCFRVTKFYKNKNIKIVNIHSVGLLPLGVFLKYYYGARLVYDTHELETEQFSGMTCKKALLKILEKLLIYKADLIFVVSDSIAMWYANNYKIRKPAVIYNALKFKEIQKKDIFRKTFNIKKHSIILLYQGGLLKDRGLELWIEAFKKRTDNKIVIIFMGYGELEEYIKQAAQNYPNNIFFHPAVDPFVLLEYTSSADVATVPYMYNDCLNYLYCMPNKLFEYTMAGLPVIVSNLKDMTNIVNKYKLGVVVKENSINAINKAINEILSQDLEVFNENALKFSKDYCWERQEEKMIREYNRLLNKCVE